MNRPCPKCGNADGAARSDRVLEIQEEMLADLANYDPNPPGLAARIIFRKAAEVIAAAESRVLKASE